jgi:mannosyl-oligosaccharide glucosidase
LSPLLLLLVSLCPTHRFYSGEPGPYAAQAASLYTQLRQNLVGNVAAQYRRTGYLWEQYSDADGKGKGSHPFTGWTALVALAAGDHFLV